MAEKVTLMILKVNLHCPCCYKKIKNILCKFPQIRDQVYDEEKNLVKITVVCCSPEKIRDKLYCKGSKLITRIEIVEPPPPKPKQPQKPQPKEPEKKPEVVVEKPIESGKPKEAPKSDRPKKPEPAPPPPIAPVLVPAGAYPYPYPYPYPYQYPYPSVPAGYCCGPCSEGYGSGPCHYGYGRPAPPPPCYENYGYWYSSERGCHVSRCNYFSEQNTGGCTIM